MRVLSILLTLAALAAADVMPAAQQNALVQKYCAVCHTDASPKGGLTLEHFDAAQAAPSLFAMLLSKLTGGVTMETAHRAPSDGAAAALVKRKMRTGAMGASGIPIPDEAIIDALIHAFAAQAAGATEWTVEHSERGSVTASVVREAPSTIDKGEAEAYRVIASCNRATHEGEVQLAWAPTARAEPFAVSVDGHAASYFVADHDELGLAAVVLADSHSGLPFPAESLKISELFPDQTVTFSFTSLPAAARRELAACFRPSRPASGSR